MKTNQSKKPSVKYRRIQKRRNSGLKKRNKQKEKSRENRLALVDVHHRQMKMGNLAVVPA